MREEIRLGNEALGHNDLEKARQYFQTLLAKGGTEVQLRIARNRLQEIQDREDATNEAISPKKRVARKTASRVKNTTDEPKAKLVRPPDNPVVVIHKH